MNCITCKKQFHTYLPRWQAVFYRIINSLISKHIYTVISRTNGSRHYFPDIYNNKPWVYSESVRNRPLTLLILSLLSMKELVQTTRADIFLNLFYITYEHTYYRYKSSIIYQDNLKLSLILVGQRMAKLICRR